MYAVPGNIISVSVFIVLQFSWIQIISRALQSSNNVIIIYILHQRVMKM